VTARVVSVDGVDFAYRQLGPDGDVPVVLLNHLAAGLDNWDPRVVDGLAARRQVITFDNRGVGASAGTTPASVEAMAHDAVAFIQALGLDKVDLLGLSMGGFIAQVIAQEEPQLVRKIILAGTGPAGGEGIDKVTTLTLQDIARGALTLQDAKQFLFFTRTANGRQAGREFLQRLKEHAEGRDEAISLPTFRAQLKAIHRWGLQEPTDLSTIPHPVLVANGERPDGAKHEHHCPRRTHTQQRANTALPGRRTRGDLPLPRTVRSEGARVPHGLEDRIGSHTANPRPDGRQGKACPRRRRGCTGQHRCRRNRARHCRRRSGLRQRRTWCAAQRHRNSTAYA
jgi:pimeloyl-ACP methyl ester carboxylesterase